MRYFFVAMLALTCATAQAGTYELSLTNQSLSVYDMTPGDQFAPGYTSDAAGLAGLLTPVDYHASGYRFEENTVLPPSTGPFGGKLTGILSPGTELIWRAVGHLKMSVIDTDNGWDYDSVAVQTSFYGISRLPISSLEIIDGLGGYRGTYQRVIKEFDFNVEIHATNPWETPASYEIGWFHQYQIVSHSDPSRPVTAVPEPETYAMMLAGLGLMGSIARRRKAQQNTYS